MFRSHSTDGSTSRSVTAGLQSLQTVYLCVCFCVRTVWHTSWLVTWTETANVWQMHKSLFPAFRCEACSLSVRNLFMRFWGEVEQPIRVLESLTLFTLGLGSLYPTDPHYVCVCVMEQLSYPSLFTRTHTYAFSNYFLQLWKVKIIIRRKLKMNHLTERSKSVRAHGKSFIYFNLNINQKFSYFEKFKTKIML